MFEPFSRLDRSNDAKQPTYEDGVKAVTAVILLDCEASHRIAYGRHNDTTNAILLDKKRVCRAIIRGRSLHGTAEKLNSCWWPPRVKLNDGKPERSTKLLSGSDKKNKWR